MKTRYATAINPLCRQHRTSCTSIRNGFCLILTNTDFGKKKCPFYKERPIQKGVDPH